MEKIKFYDPLLFANVEVRIEKVENRLLQAAVDQYEKDGFVYYTVQLESKKDFYSLMHECVHLVTRIFEDRGIPFRGENTEMIAYYQGYWFKRIWRRLNK